MLFLQECNNTRHWYTTYSVPSLEWCYPRNSWWQSNGIRSITTVEIFKWNNWSRFMIASIFFSYWCIRVSWLFIKIYFFSLNLIAAYSWGLLTACNCYILHWICFGFDWLPCRLYVLYFPTSFLSFDYRYCGNLIELFDKAMETRYLSNTLYYWMKFMWDPLEFYLMKASVGNCIASSQHVSYHLMQCCQLWIVENSGLFKYHCGLRTV